MTFLRAQWGRVESATATPCQSRQGPIVSTKIRSFKEEEAHCPAPHPALAYKGQKGAQQNAHPDPYPPCLAWGWQTHSIHEAGAKTTGTMGSALPSPRLGQEENCPQQERTHRESGTHTEWALRERKHQGGSHPGRGIRALRPCTLHPRLL